MKNNFEQVETYAQAQVRIALERWWGLADHRGQALEMLDRLDQLTQQIYTQLREKRDKRLNTIVAGLGVGLIAKEVLEPIKDIRTMNMYEWQIEVFKKGTDIQALQSIAEQVQYYEWVTLVVFLGFALVGGLLYWFKGSKISGAE